MATAATRNTGMSNKSPVKETMRSKERFIRVTGDGRRETGIKKKDG
jgi:hypothetical protein